MNLMRGAIERLEGIAKTGFPKPPTVLPKIHHAFSTLGTSVEGAEDSIKLIPFLRSCKEKGVDRLDRRDLNRVLRGVWCDNEFEGLGQNAIERAVADNRSSTTKALVDGYLIYFPVNSHVMPELAKACQKLTAISDGVWRRRSKTYSLFDPARAPSTLAEKMVKSAGMHGVDVPVDAGLGVSLFATQLGKSAFSAACRTVAGLRAEVATAGQSYLLGLLQNDDYFDDAPNVVRALLEPWIGSGPSSEHRQITTAFLLDRISDPRIYPKKQKWDPIRAHLSDEIGPERTDAVIGVLRRWLTDVAMRTFFRAIAETTDRPDQWAQRQKFWLAYLDAGHVSDAWPALGPRAQSQIREIARSQNERLEHGSVANGPSSSSSLIMEIGDLRISEWSDNGMCRFWLKSHIKAPALYAKRYENAHLRVTGGISNFDAVGHDAGGNWRYRFASIVYRRTGIAHPQLGRGH